MKIKMENNWKSGNSKYIKLVKTQSTKAAPVTTIDWAALNLINGSLSNKKNTTPETGPKTYESAAAVFLGRPVFVFSLAIHNHLLPILIFSNIKPTVNNHSKAILTFLG